MASCDDILVDDRFMVMPDITHEPLGDYVFLGSIG